MSTEVHRAPHADDLRAPALARSSAGSPCPEEDKRSTEVPEVPGPTEAGWRTGEPAGRDGGGRRLRGRGGERRGREGGREEGALILSPPLGPLSEVAMEKGSRWHSPRRAVDPYARGKASARTNPPPPPRQASGPQRPGWDQPDPVGQMAAPGRQEESGEGQESRGFLTWLSASIALHEGHHKTRDAASRLGDPGPRGCVSHLRPPPQF